MIRCALRFVRKHYAACLLNERLFAGEALQGQVVEQIASSALHADKKLKELIALNSSSLQQWVRKSFMCDPTSSKRLQEFVQIVVKPAVQVNVSAVPERMADVLARFGAIVKGGECTEQDAINLKLAASCLSGELDAHPLVQGLALQCRRMLQREARGVLTMAGRREDCTERESSLIADAGMSLAMACGNATLCREFGLSSKACRISLDELKKNSLPTPSLAILFPDQLRENFLLADQRFARPVNYPKRAWKQKQNVFDLPR